MKPQTKISLTLIAVAMISASCGSDDDNTDDAAATTTTIAFTDVNTILTARCGGTECHSSGSSQFVYVDQESTLTSRSAQVISRVSTAKDMPPTYASATQLEMTEAERTTITNFLNQ